VGALIEPRGPRRTSRWSARVEDEAHGLCARGRVPQLSANSRGDCACARLSDAAHRHAEVLTLEDRDDSERLEDLGESVRDLGRQPLLHLRATCEDVYEPSKLGESGDPPV